MAEFRPKQILRSLSAEEVDFVVIGGLAGIAQGSSYPTFDVDIVYARDAENLERLATALRKLGATLRGAPPEVPFLLDAETLGKGLNFTFATEFGPLDTFGQTAGAPVYDKLRSAAVPAEIDGEQVLIASIDHLIAMKRGSGRTKDQLHLGELIAIADEINRERT